MLADPTTMDPAPPPMTAARLSRARRRLRLRGVLLVAGWALAFLAAADVGLNLAFPPPPPAVPPDRVPRYAVRAFLNYGRSTAGKLAHMVRPTDAASAPLVPVGWVEHGALTPNRIGPAAGGPPRLRVAVFGMSFSNHISSAMARLDPAVAVAQYAGPSAPPNHSFALYRQVRRLGPAAPPADAVVLGILASSVKGMLTQTGSTWLFASPAPYCYPRYTLGPTGQLVERWPSVRTEADLRAALADPAAMAAFRLSLSAADRYYDPFTFGGTWLDCSALARMVRRAYADHRAAAVSAHVETKDGFTTDDPDVGPTLRAMCREFAATARADGRRPLVLLIQDQGSRDHLYRLLAPGLAADGVPSLSTHDLVDTADRTNFIPGDQHFTPANDDRIARAVLARLDAGR